MFQLLPCESGPVSEPRGVFLADVSGKGTSASILMANLRSAIRGEYARGGSDPVAMLERVNAKLLGSTIPEQYATVFLGEYDERTRRLNYVNCGQQEAVVLRCDGSVERLETTALPLGLFKSWTGEMESVELRTGDTVYVSFDAPPECVLQ